MGLPAAASRAISEVLYGLYKAGDIKLTRRTAGSWPERADKVGEHCGAHFSQPFEGRYVEAPQSAACGWASSRIGQDMVLDVDLSDIQKRYCRSMEHLGR